MSTLLNFFKSTETGFNLSASNSANLSISNLSTSYFKLAKSFFFLAIYDVSTAVIFFKSDFDAELGKSNATSLLLLL